MIHSLASADNFKELEERYRLAMESPLAKAAELKSADIVVGIPFLNEVDTLPHIIDTVTQGLERFYPNKKCAIVAISTSAGTEALDVMNELPSSGKVSRFASLLGDERLDGRGWAIRAIMDIARNLGADLAIIEADLQTRIGIEGVEGLTPEWIRLLIDPIIIERMDLVLSRFNRHYSDLPMCSYLTYPLLSAIYGHRLRDVTGVEWGFSNRLIRMYLREPRYWATAVGTYGIDIWLTSRAITDGANICEANLGIRPHRSSPQKQDLVCRQTAQVLLEQIVADREWWEAKGEMLHTPPSFGIQSDLYPDERELPITEMLLSFHQGLNRYHAIYESIMPDHVFQQLKELMRQQLSQFEFSPKLWAQVLYRFVLAYAFSKEFTREDLLDSLIPIYYGQVAGIALEMHHIEKQLETMHSIDDTRRMTFIEHELRVERQLREFLRERPAFLTEWEKKEEALKPPLPKVTYREFIPGVPLVVPEERNTPSGARVQANSIYESLAHKYKEQFNQFVQERLTTNSNADSPEIARMIKLFLLQIEEQLNELLPGDLHTLEGATRAAEATFRYFPHNEAFLLSPGMAEHLLRQMPPSALLTKLGYTDINHMLQHRGPEDILALANWSEGRGYIKELEKLLIQELRPEHFSNCALQPLVASPEKFPSLAEIKEISLFDRLTGRIVISSLPKGTGGEFPKLRLFLMIANSIAEAERFGNVWKGFAKDRREFSTRLAKSLGGHWGRMPMSAHHIFESGHQRLVVERIKQMASVLKAKDGDMPLQRNMAMNLRDMSDVYHLTITLPDNRFITCCAWTWATYSFKGGIDIPTPLFSDVERNWTSEEFLREYYRATGGTDEEINRNITELMGQGRESEDLSHILLGGEKIEEEVMATYTITPEYPPAGTITPYEGNPILKPIENHAWESKYVLNAAVTKLEGKVYIVYRAYGDDEISRLGLAISSDAFQIEERLPDPIFEPASEEERNGCEDPRLTLIGNRLYMLYTAYSGYLAQIALASISTKDLLERRWDKWKRHGLVFPGVPNKDATLFPERFDGKYAMLHRVEPNMWISFAPNLTPPWPKSDHGIIAGPKSGMIWDGEKIGAGAQPIKTKYGWLLLTHGVDHATIYRLGVMLVDLGDPTKLIYRSPNFVLAPEESCAIGDDDKCWVANVVFTCGAVPRSDKDILNDDDEILVYYGAADTVICIGTAKVSDLIPEEIRNISIQTKGIVAK